jgi:hypothetical protein
VQTVYLDASAAADPDLADRLGLLAESGHRLVLVGQAGEAVANLSIWADRSDPLPGEPPRGSWYLTADPSTCRDRQPGLRTILIGPRAEGQRPTRCDATARDLRDAILEILASEAMS